MDKQDNNRMIITMRKTHHYFGSEPELAKSYSFDLSADTTLAPVIEELYDGLSAMGYSSKSIASLMHEVAWDREPEIFSEEQVFKEEADTKSSNQNEIIDKGHYLEVEVGEFVYFAQLTEDGDYVLNREDLTDRSIETIGRIHDYYYVGELFVQLKM